jgi:ADP-ribosylglycohydrolase
VLDLLDHRYIAVDSVGLQSLGPPPAGPPVDVDRVEGMLLGLAIGDALGNTTEGQSPRERHEARGEIRGYLPNRYAGGRAVGLPSDDTQLTFWTLEHLLQYGEIVPDRLAELFADRRIFGIGRTVRAFLAAFKSGRPWYEAGQRSAGNGALMRVAPVVLPHLRRPSPDLWADAVLAGAVTHNDPSSIGACVAFVGLLWELLALKEPPGPDWWLDRYCELAMPLEGEVRLESRRPGSTYRGPIWRFVDREVRASLRANVATLEACNSWYSGAFLLETVPCVLYILARHAGDPEEAMVRAVNDTRDNDTVAAIVGAAVGALHGRRALPARWQENLLGRTQQDDDGRVFELVKTACSRFLIGSR